MPFDLSLSLSKKQKKRFFKNKYISSLFAVSTLLFLKFWEISKANEVSNDKQ